jgi:hypothetical protein
LSDYVGSILNARVRAETRRIIKANSDKRELIRETMFGLRDFLRTKRKIGAQAADQVADNHEATDVIITIQK